MNLSPTYRVMTFFSLSIVSVFSYCVRITDINTPHFNAFVYFCWIKTTCILTIYNQKLVSLKQSSISHLVHWSLFLHDGRHLLVDVLKITLVQAKNKNKIYGLITSNNNNPFGVDQQSNKHQCKYKGRRRKTHHYLSKLIQIDLHLKEKVAI